MLLLRRETVDYRLLDDKPTPGLWLGMDRPFSRRGLVWGLILFFAVLGAYYVGVKGPGRSALNRWKPQVESLWQGEDIYLRYGFPTPPIMAIILTPFCWMPGSWAMLAWFAFKSALLSWICVRLVGVVEQWKGPIPSWGFWVAALLAVRPVMGDLLHGNVNLWILYLVVAGVLCFQRGWDFLSGMSLSLAVACKLTPICVVIYFAWKRQYRLVGCCLLGSVLWWWLLPGLILGFDRNASLLQHWSDYMVRPYVSRGAVETVQTNQSAVALVHRLLSRDLGDVGLSESTSVDTGRAMIVAKGVSIGLVLLVGWLCRARWRSRLSLGWWHELGIVLLVMLLLSERSWKHHFVWLVPISLVLSASACWLLREGDHGRAWKILWLMGGAFVCMLLTSQDVVRPWAGEAGAKWMQAGGAYVWASFLLIVAHALVLTPIRRCEGDLSGWERGWARG
jgi:hypothetical protein